MQNTELRRALNYGPTASARFFIVVASTFQALRMITGAVDWASPAVSIFWALGYATAAATLLWRLIDREANPLCGWITNSVVCVVWGAGLAARAMLDVSLILTPYSTIVLMAMWSLLRTEATSNDTGTT